MYRRYNSACSERDRADQFILSLSNPVISALGSPNGLALPALMTLILDGAYLFSTDALLQMLEYRLGPNSNCCRPQAISLTLRDRVVATSDLERFAALPTMGGRISLECLDGDRRWVQICNGRWWH